MALDRTAAQNEPKVQALVAEFLEEKQRELTAEAGRGNRRHGNHILIALLALVCLGVWLAPYPAATSYVRVDPLVERASGRVTLFLAARSINHFRQSRGRLPVSLLEAGVESGSVVYSPGRDSTFSLSTRVHNQTISYESSAPLQSILGNAEEVIARTGH